MAEHEDDLEVSRRYRELGGEEPSQELDASILAEARRAAATHPAPLVPPTGRRRWYFPLAAAAVIVLVVAVTVQLEREQPVDAESVAPAPPARRTDPAPHMPKAEGRMAEEPRRAERKPAAPDAAEKQADRQEAASAAGAPAARAPMQSPGLPNIESPEQVLERIAKLREQGRDDEADRALKEFRERYPRFNIPPEMLKRVERR
jgi:hypothetical protein